MSNFLGTDEDDLQIGKIGQFPATCWRVTNNIYLTTGEKTCETQFQKPHKKN